jgi:hypothetical protein
LEYDRCDFECERCDLESEWDWDWERVQAPVPITQLFEIIVVLDHVVLHTAVKLPPAETYGATHASVHPPPIGV